MKLEHPRWKAAIREADSVLKLDPENPKALYRRALCRKAKGDLELAKADLTAALKIAPQDSGIKAELGAVTRQLAEVRRREQKQFRNMFEKMHTMELEEQREKEEAAKAEAQLHPETHEEKEEEKKKEPEPEKKKEKQD